MFLRRQGFPEEGELVLCTVTKIYHHSVFVDLDEYGKSGLIHISEVSPGRIRNIREFVKEDKKVVCLILRVSMDKGHIDLSLRRVNERQRKEKIEQIKKEQKAEKIVEMVAKDHKKKPEDLYYKIFTSISKDYVTLHDFFFDVSQGTVKMEDYGIDKAIAKDIQEHISQRMKPPEVAIKGRLNLRSYEAAGVDHIRDALLKGLALSPNIVILYEGAGKYHVTITDTNYKDAEKVLENLIATVSTHVEKLKGTASFHREEAK